MNKREKLIELLESAMDYSYILREMQRTTNDAEQNQFGMMADFLLANGVVVREKGEWKCIGGDEWCCSVCGYVASTEGRWEPMMDDFCRGCGSDMRKGENG